MPWLIYKHVPKTGDISGDNVATENYAHLSPKFLNIHNLYYTYLRSVLLYSTNTDRSTDSNRRGDTNIVKIPEG